MRIASLVLASTLVAAALVACGPPVNNAPVESIPTLKSLDEVMDVQATHADPQFKKIGAASYTDADWSAFSSLATTLDATSKKIKDFTKGPEFDAFAQTLNEKAASLAKAASAKDVAATNEALTGIKSTCKACHSKFK